MNILMNRWIYLILIIIISPAVSQAQGEYSLWTRFTLGYSLHPKDRLDAEFQYRRQNINPDVISLDKPLMESFRLWYHHQLTSDFSVSISPFAYLAHSQINLKEEDFIKDSNEIRFSAAGHWQKSFHKNWQVSNRAAVESRHFLTENRYALRVRDRLGVKHKFTDNYSLSIAQELLLNPVGKIGSNIVDHNRLQLVNEIKLLPHLKSELGYIWIQRYKAKGDFFKSEHVAMLNLYYQL